MRAATGPLIEAPSAWPMAVLARPPSVAFAPAAVSSDCPTAFSLDDLSASETTCAGRIHVAARPAFRCSACEVSLKMQVVPLGHTLIRYLTLLSFLKKRRRPFA